MRAAGVLRSRLLLTENLTSEGKIKCLGLCEVSSKSLRRAHAVHPISAVQVEYSPFTIDIESPEIGLLQTCRELGVAIVAYSPLSRGILTGQYRSPNDFPEADVRRYFPRFSEENFPKNWLLVEELKRLANTKGVTPAQLALAWLMAQGDDIFPIPGQVDPKPAPRWPWALICLVLQDSENQVP